MTAWLVAVASTLALLNDGVRLAQGQCSSGRRSTSDETRRSGVTPSGPSWRQANQASICAQASGGS